MWAVVINPIAGQGRGATLGREVAGFFASRKIAYHVITSTNALNLRRLLETFLENNSCTGVISVGGDGLAHLVLQECVNRRVPFAIIPAGTGNDFVRTLGWPLNEISEFLEHVIVTAPTPIDLGLVDSEWFGAILSTGFDSIVNERANILKWPKGPARYNVAIALELPKFKPRQYEIELDHESISTQAMLIAVANGRSYGGGMQVCPNADLHDGLFDVMVLAPISKLEFLRVFPKVYKGEHISHPAVKFYKSKKVRMQASAIAYADGERIGQLPIFAECVSDAGLTWLR